MFTASYYPDSYFPPGYWLKVGAVVAGRGSFRGAGFYGQIIAHLLKQRAMDTLLRGQVLRRVQERLTLAAALRQAEYDALRLHEQKTLETAAFAILFSES